MQIAILVYDHVTALEAVGPYEILSRLPGAETIVVGAQRGSVRCDTGSLSLVADAALAEVTHPDVLVVPGWSGSRQEELLQRGVVQEWLCAVDEHTTWTLAIGMGAIVLASAGGLTGRRATTHWLANDWLAELGAIPAPARVVRDGKYVTASGAAAGIDMALTLAATVAAERTAKAIQLLLAYDPHPPFDCGSVDKAPADMVTSMRALREFIVNGAEDVEADPLARR
ncbi:MAG: glutamine amidotransferase [Acidimicrobiia bacterium]|nr:glutamine amidotransferase [Acidimicrobiia bacterium]